MGLKDAVSSTAGNWLYLYVLNNSISKNMNPIEHNFAYLTSVLGKVLNKIRFVHTFIRFHPIDRILALMMILLDILLTALLPSSDLKKIPQKFVIHFQLCGLVPFGWSFMAAG